MKKKILFLCTHNSARSQIAEGLLRNLCGEKYEVFSAGTSPTIVSPEAIEVMKEIGIDISTHYSKDIKNFIGEDFEYVITLCGGNSKNCPFFPTKGISFHKEFEDPLSFPPGEERMKKFREVRDKIKEWIEEFFCKEEKEKL
ncbi:MAG: arsenate reductase ArsC [candidate division WOR-3 bacterium]